MINYIVLLSLVFLTIFFIYSIKAEIVPIFAESPSVKIFPNCGALSDHKIFFTVTSFSPNGNVHWEFIDSKGNIDSYGYFETDEFGGFEEYIIAEVVKPDIYTLRFFDDKNNNFLKDFNGSEVIINYQIPCANPIF
ncbi:MAG: hypothetical protein ACXWFZ_06635 [Nitrososphaeraceae archaeon]